MTEQSTPLPQQPPPPGWYLDLEMPGTQRYWDGSDWTEHVAPWTPPASKTGHQSQVLIAILLAASVIGLVMAMQSASLLTGTGTLWTGVAIAGGASIATWALRASIPTWVRVVAVVAAVIALVNVLYVEQQLEDTRQEIRNSLLP